MRLREGVIGSFTVLVGILMWLAARKLVAIPGQIYGAGSLPRVIAVLAVAVGAAQIIVALRQPTTQIAPDQQTPWLDQPRSWLRLGAAIGLMFLYALLAPISGFVIAATLLVAGTALLLGVRWWVALILAVTAAVLLREIFVGGLMVPLPRGTWLPAMGV